MSDIRALMTYICYHNIF